MQITKAGVEYLLKKRIEELGSQAAFAEEAGVSRQFVNDVLKGSRNLTKPVLDALGVREVVIYETIEEVS
jgi:hypothetical protein